MAAAAEFGRFRDKIISFPEIDYLALHPTKVVDAKYLWLLRRAEPGMKAEKSFARLTVAPLGINTGNHHSNPDWPPRLFNNL